MIEVVVDDPKWQAVDIESIANTGMRSVLQHFNLPQDHSVARLLATNDADMQQLNRDFRGKDTATNVLSWPSAERAAERPGEAPLPPSPDLFGEIDLGDIALGWETCAAEAEAANAAVSDHVLHLVIHGLLHLLGYDHENEADAELMEALEIELLDQLGVRAPHYQ